MAHAYRQIDTSAWPEITGLALHMYDSMALKDKNSLFVLVMMKRRHARWDPAYKLRDLPAAEIRVDHVAEFPIFARANHFAILFMNGPLRRFTRNCRSGMFPHLALWIFRATNVNDAELLALWVVNPVLSAGRNIDPGSGAEIVREAVNPARTLSLDNIQGLFRARVNHHWRPARRIFTDTLGDLLCPGRPN